MCGFIHAGADIVWCRLSLQWIRGLSSQGSGGCLPRDRCAGICAGAEEHLSGHAYDRVALAVIQALQEALMRKLRHLVFQKVYAQSCDAVCVDIQNHVWAELSVLLGFEEGQPE